MQIALIHRCPPDACERKTRVIFFSARTAWVALAIGFGMVWLTVVAACAQAVNASNATSIEFAETLAKRSPDSKETERRIAGERQERFRMRVAIPDAVGEDVPSAFTARHNPGRNSRPASTPSPADQPGWSDGIILLVASLLLVGMLIGKLAPELLPSLKRQLSPSPFPLTQPANFPAPLRAEEEGVTAFFKAFQRTSPHAAPPTPAHLARSPVFGSPGQADRDNFPTTPPGVIAEFQARTEKLLLTQRGLLQEINRTSDPMGQHKMLAALRWEMHVLKGEAGEPGLLPVWQVASALEGLLKQLTDRPGNITASALRTIAESVDLLHDLCWSGLDPSLWTADPIRLLVVDQNASSRDVIARALTRGFNPPDLAEDAETALALATVQAYDVIFIDLQMPDPDGLKFCSKIHDIPPNRTAAVLFVTEQSDFETHAASTDGDGRDLIGKPFLTLEITLKVLTLALRGRLQASTQAVGAGPDAEDFITVTRQQPDSA